MTLQELRIGNTVSAFGRKEVKVEGISIRDGLIETDGFAERGVEDFEGVILTDERLLRFGFCDREFSFDRGSFFLTKKKSESGYLYQAHTDRFKIKYVHQLQNLYFALIGVEL